MVFLLNFGHFLFVLVNFGFPLDFVILLLFSGFVLFCDFVKFRGLCCQFLGFGLREFLEAGFGVGIRQKIDEIEWFWWYRFGVIFYLFFCAWFAGLVRLCVLGWLFCGIYCGVGLTLVWFWIGVCEQFVLCDLRFRCWICVSLGVMGRGILLD